MMFTIKLILLFPLNIIFKFNMKGQGKQFKKKKENVAVSILDTINDDPLIHEQHHTTNEQMEQIMESTNYLHHADKRRSSKGKKIVKQQIDKMKEKISQKQKINHQGHLNFQKVNFLEKLIKSEKIKNLQKVFAHKIMRNSVNSAPVEYTKLMDGNQYGSGNLLGFQLPSYIYSVLYLLSVLQILTLAVIYSLSLVFDGVEGTFSSSLQTGSLVFYFVEIVINLTSVRVRAGKKIRYLPEIFRCYLRHTMIIDLISLLILFLDIFTHWSVISYLRLFILFKLPQCLQKIQKLQVYFIQNVYNEQYWELVKVVIYNLAYAHIIAIFLAAMAKINPSESWMHAKGIDQSPWNQQYAWSYYWANTIMLTIGFGDLVATNYQEATCVSFIETFSCLMIAYNVSCVGSIISNIRSIDQQRCKNFKVFKKLTDNNNISDNLVLQISNYIEQSSKLRKKFNYEEDKNFISQLPTALKDNYVREAHRGILCQLVFFRGLLQNTLSNFAEKIETRISHPQEVIRTVEDDFNLIILRKGQIGYTCKLSGSIFNEEIADLITVKERETPFLTSLDFISKQRPLYEIKSLSFSVLLSLAYEHFIEVFRQSDLDYELYCFLRDKIRNIPDEFEVLPCQYCVKFRHFKFTCPRLHYAPLPQHILNKELHRQKIGKDPRRHFDRHKPNQFTPLEFYANLKNKNESIQLGTIRKRKTYGSRLIQLMPSKSETIQLDNKDCIVTNETLINLFNDKAQQIISMELAMMEKKEMFFDDIWLIACDQIHDFRNYFSLHNPSTLGDRFSPKARRAKQLEKCLLMQNLVQAQNFIQEQKANNLKLHK